LQEIATGLMQQMHNLALRLRPPSLDTFGLETALQQQIEKWTSKVASTPTSLARGMNTEVRLPSEVETTLYRVAQEALTNAQRHAKASRVSVLLRWQEEFVTLIVEDNGQGSRWDRKKTTPFIPRPVASVCWNARTHDPGRWHAHHRIVARKRHHLVRSRPIERRMQDNTRGGMQDTSRGECKTTSRGECKNNIERRLQETSRGECKTSRNRTVLSVT
jgi:hypothetical protein